MLKLVDGIDFNIENKKYNPVKVLFDFGNSDNSNKFNFNKAFSFNNTSVLNLKIAVI